MANCCCSLRTSVLCSTPEILYVDIVRWHCGHLIAANSSSKLTSAHSNLKVTLQKRLSRVVLVTSRAWDALITLRAAQQHAFEFQQF